MHARGGLTFQASHVWAKSLGNVGGDAPTTFNPEIIYADSCRQPFRSLSQPGQHGCYAAQSFSALRRLRCPCGHSNRKFFSHMNRFSDLAIGGWSVSTVSLWETGPYLTPTTTSSSYDPGNLNLSYRGAFQRPDCVGNGNVANTATGSMFNISGFNPIPSGPIGNCGVGILQGPGTTTIATGTDLKHFI